MSQHERVSPDAAVPGDTGALPRALRLTSDVILVWCGFWLSAVIFGIQFDVLDSSFQATARLLRVLADAAVTLGFLFAAIGLRRRRRWAMFAAILVSALSMVDAGLASRFSNWIVWLVAIAIMVLTIRQRGELH